MGFGAAFSSAFASGTGNSLATGANNYLRGIDNQLGGILGVESAHQSASWNDYRYSANQALDYALHYNPQIQNANVAAYRNALTNNGYNPILAITNGQIQGGTVGNAQSVNRHNPASGSGTAAAENDLIRDQIRKVNAEVANVKSTTALNRESAYAARTNADANKTQANTAQWLVYDKRSLADAGISAFGFSAKGRGERVYTIRLNKVTGEAYDLSGRRVDIQPLPEKESHSAKAVAPVYNQINHYHNQKPSYPSDWIMR